MKRKNKIMIMGLLILIAGLFIFSFKNNLVLRADKIIGMNSVSKLNSPTQETSLESLVTRAHNSALSTNCQQLKSSYLHFDELSKTHKTQLRFQNIHKKIGAQIFRIRRFFKEGNEAEVENFLVYLEDSDESAKIIEKTPYKKGPQYLKVEASVGEILYQEVGVNLGEILFLHYINNDLMGAQGEFESSNNKANIDCRY